LSFLYKWRDYIRVVWYNTMRSYHNGRRLALYGGYAPSEQLKGGMLMSDYEILSLVIAIISIVVIVLIELIKSTKK